MADILTNVSIQLQREGEKPLYAQIAAALKEAIDAGQLPADSRLPSIRTLAAQLQVNAVTVVNAYRELELEGYVWSRTGSGTYVRSQPAGETARQIFIPHQGINFASATPTPEIFPVGDFKRLLNLVLDRDGGHAFGYQESQGWPPLREAMQEYLGQIGIAARLENIHIISGAQQGIDLAAKILVRHGDTVLVESPTYHGAIATFRSRGARILAVPLEPDGPDLAVLTRLLRRHRPRLFYVMPNFQNPTGYSYSRHKKRALLDLARQYEFTVVEDDHLSELHFAPAQDRGPLKAMDVHEQVIYVKSFSKILMPGLRLGLLVSPPPFTGAVGAAKQYSDISSSGLFQRTLDLYLREKAWQQHLQAMRATYGTRYRTALEALARHLPQFRLTPPGGGLHLWLQLPKGIDGDQYCRLCLREKVLLTPGSYFSPNNSYADHIRLSFAAVTGEEITQGIELMGKVLKQIHAPRTLQPLL